MFVEKLSGRPMPCSLLAEPCEQDVPLRHRDPGQLLPIHSARLATVRLEDVCGRQDVILSVTEALTTVELDAHPRLGTRVRTSTMTDETPAWNEWDASPGTSGTPPLDGCNRTHLRRR